MTSEPTILSTQDGYDRWSEIYDREVNPLVVIEEPKVKELLGDVRGLEILDVGCGTGRHTVRLASEGARATGVDFSTGMLDQARAKPGAEAVRFIAQDATGRLPFDDGSFDRVISCLVVDHVRELKDFFSELARVCRPSGFVVISVMHPAMMLKGVQARFQDPKTGTEVRPASVANQISDYVRGVNEAGLRIQSIAEYRADADLVSRAPRAEKYLDWPLLLLMKLAPPPSRGKSVDVLVTRAPIDVPAFSRTRDQDGALCVFTGVVRNHNDGKAVRYLEYEGYEEMVVSIFEEIAAEAKSRFGATNVRIAHRLGRMEIGDTSVAVSVSSPHRKEAFEACRFAIDTLKHKAPIWKKEFYADGSSWLEGPGQCAHP